MFERRTETDGFVCRIAASFNMLLYWSFLEYAADNSYKRFDYQLYELGLRPQPNIKDDQEMYKKYQGYCRFMPGGVLFLNYWRRCAGFPEKVQMQMREHWLEEVEFFKGLIDRAVVCGE